MTCRWILKNTGIPAWQLHVSCWEAKYHQITDNLCRRQEKYRLIVMSFKLIDNYYQETTASYFI